MSICAAAPRRSSALRRSPRGRFAAYVNSRCGYNVILFLAAVALHPVALYAQSYWQSLIAGAFDESGVLGEGGPATSEIIGADGLAVDGHGNLFILDRDRNRVRKVSPDGIISTYAGVRPSGIFDSGEGYSGDGLSGQEARLNEPHGIAADSAGNLYIADTRNGRIRKIDPDGTITTVAGNGGSGFSGDGGLAIRATFQSPGSVVAAADGTIYVADAGNARVRRITPDGIVSTVAGRGRNCRDDHASDGGPAVLACIQPVGLTLDARGNLYVADASAARVKRIGHNGSITTVAGTGVQESSGDGGPAIRAGLNQPKDLAVDAEGNLFIFEAGRVRVVHPNGIITTVLANVPGGGRASEPDPHSGLAVDHLGRLYVADRWPRGMGRVRLLMPSTLGNFAQEPQAGAQTTAESLRIRTLVAIAANERKYRDLIFKAESWVEFRNSEGTGHIVTPHCKMHRAVLGKSAAPVTIFDRWDDYPALQYPQEQRVLPKNDQRPTDIIQGLLNERHELKLVGSEVDDDGRAWVLEATPKTRAAENQLTPAERCASAMRATLWIDVQTAFPVRADVVVASPRMCSATGHSLFDGPGTRAQWHFVKVRRKDPCGAHPKAIWVVDRSVIFGKIVASEFRYFMDVEFAERRWQLAPTYQGGVVRASTALSDFNVFMTGSCISYGDNVTTDPVESVDTKIYFDVDDSRFREPGPGK